MKPSTPSLDVQLIPFKPIASLPIIAFKGYRKKNFFHLQYEIFNPIRCNLPPVTLSCAPGKRQDELWHHTCFELFVGKRNHPEYWEYNFSFNGDWNCYHFNKYRIGMDVEHHVALAHFESSEQKMGLSVHIVVSTPPGLDALMAGPSAVFVASPTSNDFKSFYFAPSHPVDRPDFHRADARCFPL